MVNISRWMNGCAFFRPSKTFLKIYFVLVFCLYVVEFLHPHVIFTYKNSVTALLSCIGLVPVYGYAFDRKFPTQGFWECFALVYMAWELGCYTFLYKNPWFIDIGFFLLYGPNYWCLFLYPFETLEEKTGHNKISLGKRLGLVLDGSPEIKGYQLFHCPFCEGENLKNVDWLLGLIKCLKCHRNFKVRTQHIDIFIFASFVTVVIYLVYFLY